MPRLLGLFALLLLCLSAAHAQEKAVKRYGEQLNEDLFPQQTAEKCLDSVIKAIEQRRIGYLLAHLAEPDFVDRRVKKLEGGFPEMVKEAIAKLADDPSVVKTLKRFAREGEWEKAENAAVVRLKDVKDRAIFFRKGKERWFMENKTR